MTDAWDALFNDFLTRAQAMGADARHSGAQSNTTVFSSSNTGSTGAGGNTTVFSSSTTGAGGDGAAQLSLTAACEDGQLRAVAALTDVRGNPIIGARIAGAVSLSAGGPSRPIAFPLTDKSGRATITLETPRARAGTPIVWTASIDLGNTHIETTSSCTIG